MNLSQNLFLDVAGAECDARVTTRLTRLEWTRPENHKDFKIYFPCQTCRHITNTLYNVSGYKFYFHLLGSTGCQLDVAQPRALTLSLEKCTTINCSPSLPQCVGRLVLLSSSFILLYSSVISSPSVSLTWIWTFLYPSLSYPLLDLSFSLPLLFFVSCVPLVLLISIFLFPLALLP